MLIGHREHGAAFRAAFDSKTLHHAWLLAGAQGIGKAGFARAAALWVLARSAGPQTGVAFGIIDAAEDWLVLDRPLVEQYLHWLWRVLHGDFGFSWRIRMPVGDA